MRSSDLIYIPLLLQVCAYLFWNYGNSIIGMAVFVHIVTISVILIIRSDAINVKNRFTFSMLITVGSNVGALLFFYILSTIHKGPNIRPDSL